jgi:hypothetical protein
MNNFLLSVGSAMNMATSNAISQKPSWKKKARDGRGSKEERPPPSQMRKEHQAMHINQILKPHRRNRPNLKF